MKPIAKIGILVAAGAAAIFILSKLSPAAPVSTSRKPSGLEKAAGLAAGITGIAAKAVATVKSALGLAGAGGAAAGSGAAASGVTATSTVISGSGASAAAGTGTAGAATVGGGTGAVFAPAGALLAAFSVIAINIGMLFKLNKNYHPWLNTPEFQSWMKGMEQANKNQAAVLYHKMGQLAPWEK